MQWRTSELIGYGIEATDGSIGSIDDFLFDDEIWAVRWAIVDTGSWLLGRRVLLPPSSFGRPDPVLQQFPVELTRPQVENSPGTEMDQPVSRQMEADLYGYYGWSPYWAGWPGYVPPEASIAMPGRSERPVEPPRGDPNLRSVRNITGYYLRASDDDIGHVEEFLIEDESWAIRYMVVDTRNWWPGKKVLIAPQWIQQVSWDDRQVVADLTREQVKGSPEYNPEAAVDRPYEEQLYDYYGYQPYWL